MEQTSEILVSGLVFPECPRWHEGRLWFSDVNARKIIAVGEDGRAEVMLTPAVPPAGLGWRPDGTMLVVSTSDRKLMRREGDALAEVADMSAQEPIALNDMAVDSDGRAYVGGWGFDLNGGAKPQPAHLFMVQADGRVRIAASDMLFPNGIVITPDDDTLIVAETVARRLTAFGIGANGALLERRVWAAVPVFPDGICLDAEGAVWVASPVTGECLRVREGGQVLDRVHARASGVYACMLGGADRRTLYLCTANTTPAELTQDRSEGWIETVRVEIPGAGRP